MTEDEIGEALDDAIQSDSPDEVLSGITDIILDSREEASWGVTEATIVALSTFFRWMLDGGFQTYLRMPGSFTSELVYKWVKATDHSMLEQAFKNALRVFPNTNFSDVEKRQETVLTENDIEILEQSDNAFFELKDAIYESVARFIRANRADLGRQLGNGGREPISNIGGLPMVAPSQPAAFDSQPTVAPITPFSRAPSPAAPATSSPQSTTTSTSIRRRSPSTT